MIGIFGGTFDPIHYGHIRTSIEVQQALTLDRLVYVPASIPPHRQAPQASAQQRLHMVELAVKEYPFIAVDDCEIGRLGPSYTVDTLQWQHEHWPDTTLCLVVGVDAYNDMQNWHQWQRLFQLAHVVVMQRPGWSLTVSDTSVAEVVSNTAALRQAQHGLIIAVDVEPVNISATEIRNKIANNEDVSAWLPAASYEYLLSNHIYAH